MPSVATSTFSWRNTRLRDSRRCFARPTSSYSILLLIFQKSASRHHVNTGQYVKKTSYSTFHFGIFEAVEVDPPISSWARSSRNWEIVWGACSKGAYIIHLTVLPGLYFSWVLNSNRNACMKMPLSSSSEALFM